MRACWAGAVLAAAPALGLDNGLERTPIRGWLSWERFACNTDCDSRPDECVSERLYKRIADEMVAGGWLAAGYTYVNVDDCWPAERRDPSGRIVADPARFPSGMKALAEYVRARGLKLGLYTDVGPTTCAGYPALDVPLSAALSLEEEAVALAALRDVLKYGGLDALPAREGARGGGGDGGDAGGGAGRAGGADNGLLPAYVADLAQFADWGIDSLKVDGCNQPWTAYNETYPRVGRALNATGRPVAYSCSWPAYMQGHMTDWVYAQLAKTCNSWRAFNDVFDSWASVLSIADYWGQHWQALRKYAGPGAFSDADMILAGNLGLSGSEAEAQVALWVCWASPMLMSNDLPRVPAAARRILLNREVLVIADDPIATPGRCLDSPCPRVPARAPGGIQRWHRRLSGGRHYVVMLNARDGVPGTPARVNFTFAELLCEDGGGGVRLDAGGRGGGGGGGGGGVGAHAPDAAATAAWFAVRDVLRHETLAHAAAGGFSLDVAPSEARAVVLTPMPAPAPPGREAAQVAL